MAALPNKLAYPGFKDEYFVLVSDLQKVELNAVPTPASRGWCRPGDWCATSAPALFCEDRSAYERVLLAPTGEPRRAAIAAEAGCRLIGPGHPMKPGSAPGPNDRHTLIEVEHPILKKGWSSATAFKTVAFAPPVRVTNRVEDYLVGRAKAPAYRAISITQQGSNRAMAVLRSGPAERQEFCRTSEGSDSSTAYRDCVGQTDETIATEAECRDKRFWVDGRKYELRERPKTEVSELHLDRSRRWLFWAAVMEQWIDGSTASGESTISSAFDTLCPGVNPEAEQALVYLP